MATIPNADQNASKFGFLAYLGATISLFVCFWKAAFKLIAPILGLSFIETNPLL